MSQGGGVGLVALACKPEKVVLFPAFARMALKILLLPIGTAGVERSFSIKGMQ